MTVLSFALLALAILAVAATLFTQWRVGGAPIVPTSPSVRKAVLEQIPQHGVVRIAELGAGDGRMARAFARRNAAAEVVGYELSPVIFLLARVLLLLDKRTRRRVILRLGDFRQADLAGVNVVFAYLVRRPTADLARWLPSAVDPGTTVITHTFAIPGWRPVISERASDLYRTPVYVYRYPDSLPNSAQAGTMNEIASDE